MKAIAKLWHDSWHDAHALIVPKELVRFRTPDSFAERTSLQLPNLRVADGGGISGICIIRDDELFQLFVSQNARGTGVARMLVEDAERRLSARGFSRVWLGCAVGNDRAAKFYSKCGWELTETIVEELEIPEGTFPLEEWKFEKELG